jgi:hypothetical protein
MAIGRVNEGREREIFGDCQEGGEGCVGIFPAGVMCFKGFEVELKGNPHRPEKNDG